MLVLSRTRDERIVIGGCVRVTVVDIRGDKVRLGIDAPQEIPVHREEVARAIERETGRGLGRLVYVKAESPAPPTAHCPLPTIPADGAHAASDGGEHIE